MSVLIKGMEMPKSCGECHFCHTENFHQWCCLTEETISAIDAKHFMCPLTQLEPCEDAVRREDVQAIAEKSDWFESSDSFNDFMWALYDLPSAQPERKKGTWTDDASCPFCGFQPWYERDIHTLSFCPNCGADLRGGVNGQK